MAVSVEMQHTGDSAKAIALFSEEFWNSPVLPIEHWNSAELRDRKARAGLVVVGRLKTGVTVEAAQAEISTISEGLGRQYPATNAGHGAVAVPMKDDMVRYIRPTLLLLVGAVGFVLIIA